MRSNNPFFQRENFVCSIQIKNLLFSESIVLAEVGNKAL